MTCAPSLGSDRGRESVDCAGKRIGFAERLSTASHSTKFTPGFDVGED